MNTATAAGAVGKLIDGYVARGVFRAAPLSPDADGHASFRIVWFQNQTMTLTVDGLRAEVRLNNLMPRIAPRSRLDRQLRAWLRSRSAAGLPAHRRLDPAQFDASLRNRAGCMQLGIACRGGDLAGAASKLLKLGNELYLDFFSAPAQYHWIVETFDLDPDNPRWP